MKQTEIIKKIKKVANEVIPDVDVENIDENTNLRKDLGLDSLEGMSFIIGIEREFGVTISDLKIKDIQTVADTIAIIEVCMQEMDL